MHLLDNPNQEHDPRDLATLDDLPNADPISRALDDKDSKPEWLVLIRGEMTNLTHIHVDPAEQTHPRARGDIFPSADLISTVFDNKDSKPEWSSPPCLNTIRGEMTDMAHLHVDPAELIRPRARGDQTTTVDSADPLPETTICS